MLFVVCGLSVGVRCCMWACGGCCGVLFFFCALCVIVAT